MSTNATILTDTADAIARLGLKDLGYQFVNTLYKDNDTLRVDIDLINDVREQHGGGGEPLILDD